MSRVGKMPIAVPKDVSLKVEKNTLYAEGKKGKLQQAIPEEISLNITKDYLYLTRKNDIKRTKAFHGLFRMLCANIITGVDQGFTRELIIRGVGYRAEITATHVIFNLGYSTRIHYAIPDGITIEYDKKELLTIRGIDKQQVGQVAAEIRSLRKVEPYKGKGIRYSDEEVRLKVGKAGVK